MKQQLGKIGALGTELEISERVTWEPGTTRVEADALAWAKKVTARAGYRPLIWSSDPETPIAGPEKPLDSI